MERSNKKLRCFRLLRIRIFPLSYPTRFFYPCGMAISIALKNLFKDRIRLLLSIGGVALAIMLVLILDGFVAGLYRQVSAYLDHSPGTIAVTQRGVTNLLGATSLLPLGTERKAAEVEGVSEVMPILSQFIILDLHGIKQAAYLIGYPKGVGNPEDRGGPWELVDGREPEAEDELIFDRVLAARHDLAVGDRFDVMGKEFEIAGLSDDTTSWMTSFIFMRKSAAESLLRTPKATSILLITPDPNASEESVIQQLKRLQGVDALRKATVIANDTKLLVEVFSAPLRLMAGIAFFFCNVTTTTEIYTATVERRQEYGVLKAVGGKSRFLYQLVATQALAAAFCGAVVGLGFAMLSAEVIMGWRPEFLVVLKPSSILLAIVTGIGMALLAAIVPARTIARLEPADVFRKGT